MIVSKNTIDVVNIAVAEYRIFYAGIIEKQGVKGLVVLPSLYGSDKSFIIKIDALAPQLEFRAPDPTP